jgi:hypothetical protein
MTLNEDASEDKDKASLRNVAFLGWRILSIQWRNSNRRGGGGGSSSTSNTTYASPPSGDFPSHFVTNML